MEGCRAAIGDRATDSSGYCLGLVDGIVYGETGRDTFCIPSGAGVTLGQEVRVIVAYIDARPARLHHDLRLLALEALIDAWPCKRKQSFSQQMISPILKTVRFFICFLEMPS